MNKSVKKIQEKHKKWGEMNELLNERQTNKKQVQLIQDLKIKMKVIKNTKTEGILQIENLENQTETTEASITIRLQELRE